MWTGLEVVIVELMKVRIECLRGARWGLAYLDLLRDIWASEHTSQNAMVPGLPSTPLIECLQNAMVPGVRGAWLGVSAAFAGNKNDRRRKGGLWESRGLPLASPHLTHLTHPLSHLAHLWILCRGGCSRRGVQWMGVVLYSNLVYNTIQITTPCFHCTPPLQNVEPHPLTIKI